MVLYLLTTCFLTTNTVNLKFLYNLEELIFGIEINGNKFHQNTEASLSLEIIKFLEKSKIIFNNLIADEK